MWAPVSKPPGIGPPAKSVKPPRCLGYAICNTTLPQTTTGFNTFRNSVNAAFKADPSFWDAIADFAADPKMGCDACAANTTYYPDGEHPSIAGHAILGPIAQAAIQKVW